MINGVTGKDLAARGVELFNAGAFAEAAEALKEAAAGGERSASTRIFLAHALEASGRVGEAVRLLRRLSKASPRSRETSEALSSLLLRALQRPDCERPETVAREAASAAGGEAQARRTAAAALVERSRAALAGGRAARAARLLDAALSLDGGSAQAARWRGLAAAGEGDWGAAERWLRRAAALGADVGAELAQVRGETANALRREGLADLAAGRLKEAEAALRKALRLAPEDPAGREALADVLRAKAERARLGRIEAARRAAQRASARRERRRAAERAQREAAERRARRAFAAKNWAAALAALRRLRALGADVESQLASVRCEQGRAALAEGRLARAERLLRSALPGSSEVLASALQARARDAVARDELGEAARLLEEAVRLSPADGAARAALARALRRLSWRALLEGRPASARAHALGARRLDPASARDASAAARALRRRLEDASRRGQALEALSWRERLEAVEADFAGRERTLRTLAREAPAASPERFAALMNLRRYGAALAVAERLLDRGPGHREYWSLANPWSWEDWSVREAGMAELARDLAKRIPAAARRPWLSFYRVALSAPGALDAFSPPTEGQGRYGWMCLMAGRMALVEGRLPLAKRLLTVASARRPAEWRAYALLAEAALVRGDVASAWRLMEEAGAAASDAERGLWLAWRGAFYLWVGDYRRAYADLDEACGLGAPHAFCWRGAASLMLGEARRAVAQLDETVALYPGDLEAYLWRGEAKLALGRPEEALGDLARPTGVWAVVLRALAKAGAGDEQGLLAEFRSLPAAMRRAGLGSGSDASPEPEKARRALERIRNLARGWRREEYGQRLWLRRAA